MPDKLRRILQTHDFLDRALREHGDQLAGRDVTQLRVERDRTFLQLLSHISTDRRVTLAQLNCIISALAELARNAPEAVVLERACLDIARRLADQVVEQERVDRTTLEKRGGSLGGPVPTGPLNPQTFAVLDAMPDRVGIYDSDYRFVFTNTANARFHGKQPSDFVGRPSWSMIGTTCFAKFTKPAVDKVLAGRRISSLARQGVGEQERTYSVSFDRVRSLVDGKDCVLVISRDVTALGLSTDIVVPMPGE